MSTTDTTPGQFPVEVAPTPSRSRLWWLLAGLALALLLSELDQTLFATALPTIVGELDGVQDMLWVNTAYLLAGTLMMPVYGQLSDRLGRRPLLLAGLGIFLLGSVLGGLAGDMTTLITARAVQGLGGGGMIVLVQAVVADLVPARDRAPYLSAVGAVFAVAAVAGPVLGGWLTEGVGWRWAFWLNLPLGGLAVVAVLVLLREPPRDRDRVRFDTAGLGILTAGVSALVLLASWAGTRYPWGSPVVLGLAALVVVSAAVFVAVERRAAEPIIPPWLFADRTFTVAVVAGLLMAVAMFGTVGYLPTYLQMVTGLSPTAAGLAMLTLVGGLAVGTVGSAQLVRRTGRYRTLPLTGAVLTGLALVLLSAVTPATPLWLTGGYLVVLGLGIGCAWEVLVVVVQNTAPDRVVGTATATNSFVREIGVCLGTALVGALFTARLTTLLSSGVPATAGTPLDPQSLTPALAAGLPDAVRAAVAVAYNDALTAVLAMRVPVAAVAVLALLLLPERTLATTVPDTGPARPPARA